MEMERNISVMSSRTVLPEYGSIHAWNNLCSIKLNNIMLYFHFREYIPFMCNYEFLCGSCGGELISKTTASKF